MYVSDSTSETELPMGDAMDLTSSDPEKSVASDAEKPSPAKPTEAAVVEPLPQKEDDTTDLESLKPNDTEKEDDYSHSIKTLDLTFVSKPKDVKITEKEQPQSSPAADEDLSDKAKPHEESKLTCKICKKNFRYATTLTRHEKAHQLDLTQDPGVTNGQNLTKPDDPIVPCEKKEVTEEEVESVRKGKAETEGNGSVVESGPDEDKEERSDEEEAVTEPKSAEGEPGSKPDKRKKVCSICNKRFWSLQDLTRHMRSHTGKDKSESRHRLVNHS